MASSFFTKLKNLELTVFSKKFESMETDLHASCDDIRKNLRKLIRFTTDGVIASTETELFICKNFRERTTPMINKWNSQNKNKQKSASTLRVQVRNLSLKFYKIFGDDFDTFYIDGNIEVMQKFSDVCDAIRLEKTVDLSSAFIDELYSFISDSETTSFSVSDCKDEFVLLRKLMKTNVQKNIESVDIEKISYIVNNLNKPIIGVDSRHLNSVKVWLLSHLYSLQNFDKPVDNIPILYKGKEHVFESASLKEHVSDIDETTSELDEAPVSEPNTELTKESLSEPNIEPTEGLTFLDNNEEFFDDDEVSGDEILSVSDLNFSFDPEFAQGTSLYILIDQFWDYISSDDVEGNQPTTKDEMKAELNRIKQFFALYTPKGVLNYLKAQNFNKDLFEKALVSYESAVEKNS